MRLVVHVDGGSRGNPGPAAAAAVISTPEGEVLAEISRTLGVATNNVAEYEGLLLGLRRARELGADEVEVINDSELVARQVNGVYKVKHADIKPLHAQALDELGRFERWSLQNVPRAQNAGADALVNQALDAGEGRGGEAEDGAGGVEGGVGGPPEPAAPGPQPAGGTDYAEYLLIDDLLALQRPLTPSAHDELLFIIVHQAYELWFKLVLHELGLARRELEAGRPHAALAPLERVIAVERVLMAQLDALETMSPDGFLEFRDPLAPASGFQSRQFREIERLSERPMWDAFCAAGRALGLEFPGDLRDLYLDHRDDPARAALHAVAERLVDHDEGVARWRYGHVLMAAREIGARPGTGGSRGVEYLLTTLDKRFYPELWAVRTAL